MDERLRAYVDLLRGRGIELGLVAAGDRDRILERHVEDSLRAVPLLRNAASVCDIGSGAGLPGIPLAIARPDCSLSLLEPRRRAVAFLELAVERLELKNAEVVARRVDDVSLDMEAATARAFGPLERSWTAACRVLRPGGRLIYFAGASFRHEEAEAILIPEGPGRVEFDSSPPLVIMTRSD